MRKFLTEIFEWLAMVFVAALAVRVAFDVIDGVWDAYGWCKKKVVGWWRTLRKKEDGDKPANKNNKKEDKKKKEEKKDKK